MIENEFATTLTGFLTRQPSLEVMQAVEETHLLQISFDDYQALLRQYPAWLRLHARSLEEAYVGDTRHPATKHPPALSACGAGQQSLLDHRMVVKRPA